MIRRRRRMLALAILLIASAIGMAMLAGCGDLTGPPRRVYTIAGKWQGARITLDLVQSDSAVGGTGVYYAPDSTANTFSLFGAGRLGSDSTLSVALPKVGAVNCNPGYLTGVYRHYENMYGHFEVTLKCSAIEHQATVYRMGR